MNLETYNVQSEIAELWVLKLGQWNVSVFEKETRNPGLLTRLANCGCQQTGFLVVIRALNQSMHVRTQYETYGVICLRKYYRLISMSSTYRLRDVTCWKISWCLRNIFILLDSPQVSMEALPPWKRFCFLKTWALGCAVLQWPDKLRSSLI